MYNQFSINDISQYIQSLSKNPIPDNELNNVAANIIEIMGKELTLDQQIEKEISNILKREPKTSTMEHNELVKSTWKMLKGMQATMI